ncbi:MAG: indolepyruvate ferredoxin oxidoreductase subunit alpha [Thermoprotei archaeon]|nr:MAG: indolepyruvate ferredoxin oxidoreductase subunit alpha [Thermoprotei archaeon]
MVGMMTSILGGEGEVRLLLGDEAVARGAIEAGVDVAASYPGTPATEIVGALSEVARGLGIYVEWSSNEKVALEVAAAASMAGLRALAAMKHVGLNVAADTLMSLGYSGAKGGLVVVSADDPSCHSSQNEQDNRLYSMLSYIPAYEPSDPQEAKDLTRDLFDVSEECRTPVLLRMTTRLAHTRGRVKLGPVPRRSRRGSLEREWRWTLLPVNARRLKVEALRRLERLSELHEAFKYNRLKLDGDEDVGVVASGVSYLHALEAAERLDISDKVAFLKLTSVYPAPRGLVEKLAEAVRVVLVVEEVEPFLELQVRAIAGRDVEVHGKDLLPRRGELNPDVVAEALAKLTGAELERPPSALRREVEAVSSSAPPRPPTMCPGCPHRASYYSLKVALREEGLEGRVFVSGDIGCYTLGYFPPYELIHSTLCMGSSVGLACGLSRFTNDPVVAVVGDSTFFHAALSAVANAVHNGAAFLLVVLDNGTTAMTGFQPHPGSEHTATGEAGRGIAVEDVLRGLGVRRVAVVDPYNVRRAVSALREAIRAVRAGELAAVVMRRACVIYELRRRGAARLSRASFQVDSEACTMCMACVREFACPAIQLRGGRVVIDEGLCTGCGVCVQVCPAGAIRPVVRSREAQS